MTEECFEDFSWGMYKEIDRNIKEKVKDMFKLDGDIYWRYDCTSVPQFDIIIEVGDGDIVHGEMPRRWFLMTREEIRSELTKFLGGNK